MKRVVSHTPHSRVVCCGKAAMQTELLKADLIEVENNRGAYIFIYFWVFETSPDVLEPAL